MMRYEEPKLLIMYVKHEDIITISGGDGGDGPSTPGNGLLPQLASVDTFGGDI